MKRKLFSQILTEWRSNLWIAVELLIVSVVLWFLFDNIYSKLSIFNQPLGFDYDHCYLIQYTKLTPSSPEFIPDRTDEENNQDIHNIIEMLENRPEVEAVAVSNNAYPFNPSNSGAPVHMDSLSSDPSAYIVQRPVSPSFPIVFRMRGSNGESPEELARLLRECYWGFLAADNLFDHLAPDVPPVSEFKGKPFNLDGWRGDSIPLVGTYKPFRYDDFSDKNQIQSFMFTILPENYYWAVNEMTLRVHENMDSPDFIKNLMVDASRNIKSGNYRISAVRSFKDVRHGHIKGNLWYMRQQFFVIGFLALNIFLGILGTFWFRTRRRTREIALRMTCGASASMIFRRIISEGELILLFITPFAALIDWALTHWELNFNYHGYFVASRFFACVGLAWASMALMILIGVAIPAWRAMHIAPAVALKDD